MAAEPYQGSIFIAADPETVFEYFIKAEALVRWLGDAAVLEPYPGGRFSVAFGPRTVEGRYLELDRPRRVVISWGRVGSRELLPGASRLEVDIRPEHNGSRVSIVHSGLPDTERPRHVLGWQHYLVRLIEAAEGAVPSRIRCRRTLWRARTKRFDFPDRFTTGPSR